MSTIQLKSSDDKVFSVDLEVAKQSLTIKTMLEDLQLDSEDMKEVLPLPNVDGVTLALFIQWAEHRKEEEDKEKKEKKEMEKEEESLGASSSSNTTNTTNTTNNNIKTWEKEFLDKLAQPLLFSLIMAANYLDVETLVDAGCMAVADKMAGKDIEGIREVFGIKDHNFTEEELEELRKQNEWCQ